MLQERAIQVLKVYVAGESDPFIFSVLPEDLNFTATSGMFATSTRFLFEIKLMGDEPAPINLTHIITVGDMLISYNHINDMVEPSFTDHDGQIWLDISKYGYACPTGWQTLILASLQVYYVDLLYNLPETDLFKISGYNRLRGVEDIYAIPSFCNDEQYSYLLHKGHTQHSNTVSSGMSSYLDYYGWHMKPLCYRMLP